MDVEQIAIANYHYKRYSIEYFLESISSLNITNIELWASGPQFHLEDYSYNDINLLKQKLKSHNLTVICLTPEQCVYPISLSHPEKNYRNRSIDYFKRHIYIAVELECRNLVITSGINYLDVSRDRAWQWCRDAIEELSKVAEREGVNLLIEPLTPYTTNIFNTSKQIIHMIRQVGSSALKVLADTDVIENTGLETMEKFVSVSGQLLEHVHFVDGHPGGHLIPGDGSLDLDKMFNILVGINYKKYIGTELLDRRYTHNPHKASQDILNWFFKRLNSI